MTRQSPQRRYWRWFSVLVVLVMLVAVPVVVAAHHYQQGVEGQCAEHFADKSALAGYHWSWWWLPGWVCEFERDGRRWERRLW